MNPWKVSTFVLAGILALVIGINTVGSVWAGSEQPRMRTALKFLLIAKGELAKATPDKGGHRAKALEATTSAIDQVQKGIKFDKTH